MDTTNSSTACQDAGTVSELKQHQPCGKVQDRASATAEAAVHPTMRVNTIELRKTEEGWEFLTEGDDEPAQWRPAGDMFGPFVGDGVDLLLNELQQARTELVELKSANRPGLTLIHAERERQLEEESWRPEHDDFHGPFVIASAAMCYRHAEDANAAQPDNWPWSPDAWKPKCRRRNLVRAGALFLAAAESAGRLNNLGFRNDLKDHVLICAHLIDSMKTTSYLTGEH